MKKKLGFAFCKNKRKKEMESTRNSLPKVANTPQAAQITKHGPIAPTLARTDFGEIKIPEPITVPTMTQIPLIRPT